MADSSFGTLMKIGDGATPTEAFTTIAEVLDITGPELTLGTEESTNHSSPGGWAEFVPTVKDGGEVGFEVNFLPSNATHSYAAGLIKDFDNKTKRNFQIVFPDSGNTTWLFAAFVTKFAPKAPVAGRLAADVTLKVTGQPTLA